MRLSHSALILLLSLRPAMSQGPTVLQMGEHSNEVFVSHGATTPWLIDDNICLVEREVVLACGTVTSSNDEGAWAIVYPMRAVVQVKERREKGNGFFTEGEVSQTVRSWKGLEVRRARIRRNVRPIETKTELPPSETLAAVPLPIIPALESPPIAPKERDAPILAAAAPAKMDAVKPGSDQLKTDTAQSAATSSLFAVGLNYVFPFFHYQYLLSDRWSVGLGGMLLDHSARNGAQMKGFGALLSVNYHGQGGFQGLWAELGAGSYTLNFLTEGEERSASALAFLGHLGWRWRWESGPTFGFAAGAHRLMLAQTDAIAVGTNGWFPSLAMEIGFPF